MQLETQDRVLDAEAGAHDPAVRAEARRRRTFAIISHPDAGKTTLTEKILLYSGSVEVAGMVRGRKNQRAATSDWMEIERQRGISITSTALSVDHRGFRINLLDTPGHQDFSEDTYRTLMAADCAVMVLDATKGVETQTVKLFQVCARRGIPILTFVNKMDRPGSDPLGILGEIERVLGIGAAPLNWPIGVGHEFRGICDRRSRTVHLFSPEGKGSLRVPTVSGSLDDETCPIADPAAREAVVGDMELLEIAGVPFDHETYLRGKVTPVFYGSALTNFGIEAFYDAFLELSPPPGPRPAEAGPVAPDRAEFSGFVFKIQANMDPKHRDTVAFLRVNAGRFVRDMDATNSRTGVKIRLARSHRLFASGRDTTDEAFPGDIIGLAGAGEVRLGDTFYAGEPVRYEPLPQFPPECFARLNCLDTAKRKNFDKGLDQLTSEGAVRALINPHSLRRELILAAVGRLQFDVVQARLETEYGVSTHLDMLSHTLARRVAGDPADLAAIRLPHGAIATEDVDGHPVVLFTSEWHLQTCQQNHPKLTFTPMD